MGSLAAILQFIQIFEALLPVVKTGMTTIQSLIPDAAGSTKLAAVKAMAQGAFSAFGNAAVEFEHVWSALNPVITVLVATAKAEGVFTNKVAGNIQKIEDKVTTAGGAVSGLVNQVTGANPAPPTNT